MDTISPTYRLSDAPWDQIKDFLPANGRRGGQWKDHRLLIDGILDEEAVDRTGALEAADLVGFQRPPDPAGADGQPQRRVVGVLALVGLDRGADAVGRQGADAVDGGYLLAGAGAQPARGRQAVDAAHAGDRAGQVGEGQVHGRGVLGGRAVEVGADEVAQVAARLDRDGAAHRQVDLADVAVADGGGVDVGPRVGGAGRTRWPGAAGRTGWARRTRRTRTGGGRKRPPIQ